MEIHQHVPDIFYIQKSQDLLCMKVQWCSSPLSDKWAVPLNNNRVDQKVSFALIKVHQYMFQMGFHHQLHEGTKLLEGAY